MPARIIALSNQKGGVGKTTTAVNLATAMAACGHRVLVVDFDPQGNTTTGFGIDKRGLAHSSYSLVMNESSLEDSIVPTQVPGLSIVPSTIHLSGAEVELVPAMARETRLKEALAEAQNAFDYVFIDCPPSLGLLTINALVASTDVLIPLQCEFFAMEGLSQLFKTLELVKKNLNPRLEILGVLLTMYDKRNNLANQVVHDVRQHLGHQVFDVLIPRNVRLSEAPSHGAPGLIYDVKSAGSQAYIRLAAELIQRLSQPAATPRAA
ncbi:MAG: chromosome partitioning protein ParA [Alphaproteobacteria bacterium CG_4_10_14_0_8_um_filter_53_9]|nr:MAG: chromosome partitioning protein ParA [Alphaproteobacteria bacterium CG_4_10_14_0_8_um_filter_53_9]